MRLLSIFLSILFFMATTGFSVYEHYCNGQLLDTSVYVSEWECSSEHEKHECSIKAVDCCENQMDFVKLDVNLKHSEWQNLILPILAPLLHFYNGEILEDVMDEFNHPFIAKSLQLPLYIYHQQLIFYN